MVSGFSLGLDAPNRKQLESATRNRRGQRGSRCSCGGGRWGVDVGCGAGCPLGLIKFEMPRRNTGLRFSRRSEPGKAFSVKLGSNRDVDDQQRTNVWKAN